MTFQNKKIILGISGGIAAYKSALLVRLLVKSKACVRVVMTKDAQQFITPLTFQALTGEPVYSDTLHHSHQDGMVHIELARWADQIIIAPASANILAKIAHGLANDLLSCLALATQAPIVLAPAMNQAMWSNAATQANVATLMARGICVLETALGEQACGDFGLGRMLEPDKIYQALLPGTRLLANQRVVITAGATKEPIDPVRYLTNHSSGKMGYALAEAAQSMGAKVVLISGSSQLPPPLGVQMIYVTTAQKMRDRAIEAINTQPCDLFIASAAVADYRPATVALHKIKKQEPHLMLNLIRNPDIVTEVAQSQRVGLVVGFAAETQNCIQHAQHKLKRKKLDAIIASEVGENKGFDQLDMEATLLFPDGHKQHFQKQSKPKLARQLLVALEPNIRKNAGL